MRLRNTIVCLLLIAAPLLCEILVNGAGATFPYPIYARWFDEFHRLHPDTTVNYQPVGSGAGIRQLRAGVVDFGASDCPVDDPDLRSFPAVIGAVVLVYHVPGVASGLDFTPAAIAGIYLGNVSKWNDPALAAANPGIKLPDAAIRPVHRADGSGTTFILADFLAKTSTRWQSRVGTGMSLNWPAGVGAKGSEGIAAMVKQTPYSFGYVELSYAVQNRLAYGRVRNRAGRFIQATAKSMTAAARGDQRSLTDPTGKDAYPIAGYTWLLAPATGGDPARRRAMAEFLRWMLVHGQRMAEPLGYAPLPRRIVAKTRTAVDSLR